MTLTTNKPTGIIRSTSRAITSSAEGVVELVDVAKTTLRIANKYLTSELANADENVKVSSLINHAENIQELVSTFGCTTAQAEKLLS